MGVPWAPAAVGSLLGVRVYLCVCFGDKSPRGGGEPARGCSEPRNHIPVRECSRGEGGEAPSQPPAGLGGAGGRLPAEEEEEKARIFLNERLAPRPTPPPGSRLPPPSRHSPVSLRGAASFYSDGAEPRLFRVVTKPAGAPRRGCGGKRCRCRGHPTVFAHVEKKRHFLCSVQVNLSKEFFFMKNGRLAQSKGHAVRNP
ncbi:E3 ubiquitin-protein ligase RNF182 isoform X2 [Zonotrichia albicollis]|uniref:E3 ubiquitin-protein ligase RNF182 isoform X2 n=1 Tax=Zonotrichia albicollis TaxID=44394 RepID=UPI003D810AEE